MASDRNHPDDTDKTPTATPAAKRSSGEHRLEDTCPKCAGLGCYSAIDGPASPAIVCALCNGAKVVPLSVATGWLLDQGRALDSSNPPPPAPDTERNKER